MQCIIDNEKYGVIVPFLCPEPGNAAKAWATNHFVRHCIMESHLGLYSLCSITREQVAEYYAILHRGFLCPLLPLQDCRNQQPCGTCRSLAACFEKCKPGLVAYASFLLRVVADDAKKPRHVYYDSPKDKNNIAFIADSGAVVVAQKKGRQMIIKSGYRRCPLPASLRKPQALPPAYYLNAAKLKFKNAQRRGAYTRIRYVAPQNW